MMRRDDARLVHHLQLAQTYAIDGQASCATNRPAAFRESPFHAAFRFWGVKPNQTQR